jgi:hypothetical protein
MPARLEEAGLRRYELARASFAYDPQRAFWHRGRLHLTDEQVDRREPWRPYLRRLMRTRPPRHMDRRDREPWRRAVAQGRRTR